MSEQGSLAWAIEEARKRPGEFVVRNGGDKARWNTDLAKLEWERGIDVGINLANLTGWSLVESAWPKIEAGTWWRHNSDGVAVRIFRADFSTVEFSRPLFYKEAIQNFLRMHTPCPPPPDVAAVDKLIEVATGALKWVEATSFHEQLKDALKAVQEARK